MTTLTRPVPKAILNKNSHWGEETSFDGADCKLRKELQAYSFDESSPLLAWTF